MIKQKNGYKFSTIILVALLAISSVLTVLPIISAQEPPTKKTYAYIGAAPNPVQVNQPVLFHVGISAQAANVNMGWEGLSITVTRPDGEVETITDIRTDSTGGTSRQYTPTMVGEYTVQSHYPEQVTRDDMREPTMPVGGIMLASDSEELTLVVQEEPLTYYPGHQVLDEYWTRPVNAQFFEWAEVTGDWLRPAGSYTMPPIPKYHSGNADSPDAPHILWTKPYTQGGLASAEMGYVQYEMGDAYELKFMGSVIMSGVLYYNAYEDQGSNPELEQTVIAVDLKTGEELWAKSLNNERLAFGQTFFWDSYNYHGIFGYLWTTSGGGFGGTPETWKAWDPQSGRWEYTMENVPSGWNMYGPKGEIYRYTVNTNAGTISLWNSSRVVSNEGSWRPQGNTYNASAGIEWTKPIQGDLPGSACSYHLFDKVVGSTSGGIFGGASPEITNWAIDVSPGHEGEIAYNKTETLPPGLTLVYSDTIPDNDVMIVSAKENRKYYAFSLTNGDKVWETEPEGYLAFYDKWYGPAYGYGKFFTGRVSGVVTCYDLETGDVEWTFDVKDIFHENTWSNNYQIEYHFLADGKICLSYGEHSPINPLPRGGPLIVLDVETGTELWRLSWANNWWGGHVMIGDSTMVGLNAYDNRLYAIGKGPSKTTLTIQDDIITHGTSALVKGNVFDVSPGTESAALKLRFPEGVPAVSDDSMTDWMQYVYMQFERPTHTSGVTVKIEAYDPNGNYQDLGTTTTDANGNYGFAFEPEVPGLYYITAVFEGSDSYFASEANTYLQVDPAPTPATPIEPEEPDTPDTPDNPDTPDTEEPAGFAITTEIAIIAAVAVAAVIGVAAYWFLKRK
jgi:outer membrane protein assembly factor BamB